MFDNAIFASFIPQILMVIAYISCVIAPNFTKQDDVDVTETPIYKVVLVQSTSSLPSQTISFDNINLISELFVPKIENTFPNAFFFKKIFPEVVFDISKSLKFFSFLRPPPSF
ncbi:MAG: hypothetical protein GZ091_09155 [Paludibacter sp.]|nr:hypothetical protein [Paludibacter sp.]